MNVWLCTKRRSHLTAANETMADTIVPSTSIPQSGATTPASRCFNALKIFSPPAPTIVGMPTRKENSVPDTRFVPQASAAMIVEPDLDNPGNATAASWPPATARDEGQVTSGG